MHSIRLSLTQYNEVSLLSLHNIKGIDRHEGAYVKWTISEELACSEPLFIYQQGSFSFPFFSFFFWSWLSKCFHGKRRGRQPSRATTEQCAFRTLLFLPLFLFPPFLKLVQAEVEQFAPAYGKGWGQTDKTFHFTKEWLTTRECKF